MQHLFEKSGVKHYRIKETSSSINEFKAVFTDFTTSDKYKIIFSILEIFLYLCKHLLRIIMDCLFLELF